jgi:hypothetical protein
MSESPWTARGANEAVRTTLSLAQQMIGEALEPAIALGKGAVLFALLAALAEAQDEFPAEGSK